MDLLTPFLTERQTESAASLTKIRDAVSVKLAELEEKLRAKKVPTDLSQICIYATGSYGRGEASKASDIDLLIIDIHPGGDKGERSLTEIDEIRLKAKLVEVCEELELPEFDGDGRFLTVHLLRDMLGTLGSDRDDAQNFFTARLLLLLESQPLYNEPVYEYVLKAILDEYFIDFQGHEEDFVPAYLVNDMVRFWKTLCLNYEHARRKDMAEPMQLGDEEKLKVKYKLKNLKLGFSRIMTCFSALTLLVAQERERGGVVQGDVSSIVTRSPIDRLLELGEDPKLATNVETVLEKYSWFLENFGDKKTALTALKDERVAQSAFREVGVYRSAFYELLNEVGEGGRLASFVTM